MFHNAGIGDRVLANELLLAIQPRLEPLAASLFSRPKDALAWMAKLVARSVIHRRRYWNGQPLLAWILSHAPVRTGELPLWQLTSETQQVMGENCLWNDLVLNSAPLANDVWALAASVGWLEIEEAAAGAGCSPAEMAEKNHHLKKMIIAHCLGCASCEQQAVIESNEQQELNEALFRVAQRSLRAVLLNFSLRLQPGNHDLLSLVEEAIARESRARQLRLRMVEAGLIGLLALFAFLAGRYAGFPAERLVPSPIALATPASPDVFYYTVRANDSLENISARLQLPASAILTLNNLPAGSSLAPGQRLRLPYASLEQHLPSKLEFTPNPTATSLPADAPLDAFLQRAAHTTRLWQTLWADVQVIDYGPVGYYGPPQQVLRKQIWISQPDYVRIIYGPLLSLNQVESPRGALLQGEPEGSLTVSAGILFGQDFHNGATYRDLTNEILPDLDLQKLIFPKELPPGLSISETGQVAWVSGRLTRVLDAYNPFGGLLYRYWVDEQSGLVLRRREFSGADPGIALRDIIVTQLDLDVELPAEVFNPSHYPGDHFAQNYSGLLVPPGSSAPPLAEVGRSGHEPLPVRSAPPGYDPSVGRLSFQWSVSPTGNGAYQPSLELFSGGYFWGKVRFSEVVDQSAEGSSVPTAAALPSILTCKRSQDGRRLAFSMLPASSSMQKSIVLYILDLFNPFAAAPVFPDLSSLGDFAFSANGDRLAFFACRRNTQACAVYLSDLTMPGEEPLSLMVTSFADYFLWSPDSQQLGFLAAQGPESARSWNYVVLRLEDGAIVEQSSFDWRRLAPVEGSIASEWSKGSPVQAGGLDECATPP